MNEALILLALLAFGLHFLGFEVPLVSPTVRGVVGGFKAKFGPQAAASSAASSGASASAAPQATTSVQIFDDPDTFASVRLPARELAPRTMAAGIADVEDPAVLISQLDAALKAQAHANAARRRADELIADASEAEYRTLGVGAKAAAKPRKPAAKAAAKPAASKPKPKP